MASSVFTRLKPVIVAPTGKHTATAICLHGSGDEGGNFANWISAASGSKFTFPHVRLVFPSAPSRPYTAALGQPSNVWFDRQQISPFVSEDVEGIQDSCDHIRELVEAEIKSGIQPERIVIGGFSMGGALALYYGMRCGLNLAGIFVLSSFLADKSIVYDDLEEDPGSRPPVLQAHGECDMLVRHVWGRATHQRLKALGVTGDFHSFPNLLHEINRPELRLLHSWIGARLPET